MRETQARLPLIFLIAVTRGMAGVGIGLLVADRIKRNHRRSLGGVLLGVGALSTMPLLLGLFRTKPKPTIANVPQSGVQDDEVESWQAV